MMIVRPEEMTYEISGGYTTGIPGRYVKLLSDNGKGTCLVEVLGGGLTRQVNVPTGSLIQSVPGFGVLADSDRYFSEMFDDIYMFEDVEYFDYINLPVRISHLNDKVIFLDSGRFGWVQSHKKVPLPAETEKFKVVAELSQRDVWANGDRSTREPIALDPGWLKIYTKKVGEMILPACLPVAVI